MQITYSCSGQSGVVLVFLLSLLSIYLVSQQAVMRRSIRNVNIPPPGKPRAFECFLCPGSREFDLKGHPGGGEFDFAWVGWGI